MSRKNKTDIAIIGLGCIFPKSSNLKEYWNLLFNGIDAIQEIPGDSHWKLEEYFDEDPLKPDHTYCRRGGFLPEISFDPLKYGIPPNNIEATDTSQLLGLEVARMALEDSGYPPGHPVLQNRKVNVILGVTGTQELVIPLGARLGHPLWKKALRESGIEPQKQDEIIEKIQSGYVEWQENSFPGLLGNVVAGRIANRLNLSGTNSVSDAACASSLSAVHTAVMELVSGKCDISITGGVDTLNDIFMHMCFSKTGVLSKTSDAKPFSKDADGTVLGEGIGMMVLKRLEDAVKDQDKIYAVIKGVGTSSDGRTSAIYAPEAKGQIKALDEAYHEAGIEPSTVKLVEAHGTGTKVGDKVEFDALNKCFEQSKAKQNWTALGSVKSMIGHTKAAAGAAGMIKAVLSLYNKTLPPTLKADHPDPDLHINETPFHLNSKTRPWLSDRLHPRRSGVSAFGFGGSNFHVVLEEFKSKKDHVSWDGNIQIIAFSGNTEKTLKKQIENFLKHAAAAKGHQDLSQTIAWQAFESRRNFSSSHDSRMLIVHKKDDDIFQTLDAAEKRLKHAEKFQDSGQDTPHIYPGSGQQKEKLGFLFPGQGSQYTYMGQDLFSVFPEALEKLENMSEQFARTNSDKMAESGCLQEYMFPVHHLKDKTQAENELRKTDITQPAIGAVSLAMVEILKRFGVLPDAACGHSFGELSALCAAGWLDDDSFCRLAAARGRFMAEAGSEGDDAGSMLAVQAPLAEIEALVKEHHLKLILANKNSPTQGVLSGPTDQILKAKKICRDRKLRAIKLPVAAAFHSKFVKNAAEPFKKELSTTDFQPKKIQVFSNTTGRLYPENKNEVRTILGSQIEKPVHFVDNIKAMFETKVTTFVELGPKSVLTGLTRSILENENFSAVSLDQSSGKKSGIEDLAHVLCFLASKGFSVKLDEWEESAKQPELKKISIPLTGANKKAEKKTDSSLKQEQTDSAIHIKQEKSAINIQETDDMNSETFHAIQMVQKGLEAMQKLQEQTAKAHEKFLDTQAQASRTLAGMMEQTRNLALNLNAAPVNLSKHKNDFQNIRDDRTVKRYEDHSTASRQVGLTDDSGGSIPAGRTSDRNKRTPDRFKDVKPPEYEELQPADLPASEVQRLPGQNDEKTASIQAILHEIVARLTGFPVEMLEPDMDIESDLGIDSIKKVEIISELEKQIPSSEGLSTESIGSVKTLKDICEIIAGTTNSGNPSPLKENHIKTKIRQTDSGSKEADAEAAFQNISDTLIHTISELTGFPADMLEPSMNLESDLGIDSIKRVEILSRLEQEIEDIESISSDDIASLKTIGEIIHYLTASMSEPDAYNAKKNSRIPEKGSTELAEDAAGAGNRPPKETSDLQEEKPGSPEKTSHRPSDQKKIRLARQVIQLNKYPTNQIRFFNGSKIELPAGKKIYITKDSSKIADRFKAEFKKAGYTAKLIDFHTENIPDLPDAAGLIIIPDAFVQNDSEACMEFLTSAFLLVKQNAKYLEASAGQKGAFLAGVSFLGGGFGFNDADWSCNPVYGGLAGLIKTADIEFPNILCRVLDLPDSVQKCRESAEAAAALMMINGSVEMGLDGENCNIPRLVSEDLPADENSSESFGDDHIKLPGRDDTFIISGGAKGVTAACAVEMARQFSPNIVLIGRSPEPFEEPEWALNITEASALKKKIFENRLKGRTVKPADVEKEYKSIVSNREIKNNIKLMQDHGSSVLYFSADIQNTDAVESIAKKARDRFGSITALVHGAGVLEDKLITDKSLDKFNRVIETKIKGIEALLSATEKDPLKYIVLFSSIAARTGNKGQCDYAMANEVLNKTARKLFQKNKNRRVLSMNWGPWEGGMVNGSLKKEFLRKGIELIPLHSGARILVKEMTGKAGTNPEIVIGAHLIKKEKPGDHRLSKVMNLQINADTVPALNSHKIDDHPVLPFALLMDFHAHAAVKNNPGLVFAGMDNMRLLKGITLEDQISSSIDINVGKLENTGTGFKISSTISSTNENSTLFNHSSCDIILKSRLPDPPVLSKAAFMDLQPYSLTAEETYNQILFHGKDLQCIQSIEGCSEKGIGVISRLSPSPEQWMNKPYGSKWVTEPLMLDAAFQAAILWSHETTGQVCLPAYIANFRIYSSFETLKGSVRILFTVNEKEKNRIRGYFTFLDDNNTVIASITGFEAITDISLNQKFKKAPLYDRKQILAFAQGNPSEAFGDKYIIFDEEREIARLPRPPYFFMDRVTKIDHPQWEMKPGGWIEAQYDVPTDAWYFKANRTESIPFCILLEIALQPCGWLAAYAGSALQSSDRLHFRNLGGKAVLYKPVSKSCGTLTVTARLKDVSKAGGMIIQDFDMKVLKGKETVYEGSTNFGFFTKQALSSQIGIRNCDYNNYEVPPELACGSQSYSLKDNCPVSPFDQKPSKNDGMPSKALRMIDKIEILNFDAGIYNKGYIRGIKKVDPLEWFFDAHFYQDPVCPGSLGIESFLQLTRFFLLKKFNISPEKYEPHITEENNHEWSYRGQIIPQNKEVVVETHIKKISSSKQGYHITADGALSVDDICIYEMKNFSFGFKKLYQNLKTEEKSTEEKYRESSIRK